MRGGREKRDRGGAKGGRGEAGEEEDEENKSFSIEQKGMRKDLMEVSGSSCLISLYGDW